MALVDSPVDLSTIYKALWDNHLAISRINEGERFVSPTYAYINTDLLALMDSAEIDSVNAYLDTWNLSCNYYCFRKNLYSYLVSGISTSGNFRVTDDGGYRVTVSGDRRIIEPPSLLSLLGGDLLVLESGEYLMFSDQ